MARKKAKTRFYKDVQWLEPFFERARGLVPLHKIKTVVGYKVPLNKIPQQQACIIAHNDGKYTISIQTYDQVIKTNLNNTFTAKKHRRRFIYDILASFAHELAHLKEWEHTPEHWDLECQISRRFIRELKKRNVKDVTSRRPVKDERTSG